MNLRARIAPFVLVALGAATHAANGDDEVRVGVGVSVGRADVAVAVEDDASDDPPAVTVESFHEPLDPYGRWIETVNYGWVWHPHAMPDDWRPYSYGHWECTEMGWMFVSDHPWGWACYHYGRWLNTPDNGWVWLPGTVWAPAWVAWRAGGEHIGWAPLPPEPHYRPASTVIVEERQVHLDFVFVHGRSFQEPCRPALFVPPAQQVNIINQTTNITQVNVVNNTVVNNGPQVTQVQKFVNKPVKVVNVSEVQKTEINNFQQDVAKTSPEKAERIARTTSAVEKGTTARVNKAREKSPEIRQRAAMIAPKNENERDPERRRNEAKGDGTAGGRASNGSDRVNSAAARANPARGAAATAGAPVANGITAPNADVKATQPNAEDARERERRRGLRGGAPPAAGPGDQPGSRGGPNPSLGRTEPATPRGTAPPAAAPDGRRGPGQAPGKGLADNRPGAVRDARVPEKQARAGAAPGFGPQPGRTAGPVPPGKAAPPGATPANPNAPKKFPLAGPDKAREANRLGRPPAPTNAPPAKPVPAERDKTADDAPPQARDQP